MTVGVKRVVSILLRLNLTSWEHHGTAQCRDRMKIWQSYSSILTAVKHSSVPCMIEVNEGEGVNCGFRRVGPCSPSGDGATELKPTKRWVAC
jgi:hypothetical protein